MQQLALLVLCGLIAAVSCTLEVVYQWRLLQYDFPADPAYVEKFEPENAVATGLEIGWDRIFVAVPRLRSGVPATLAWIPRGFPHGVSPVLKTMKYGVALCMSENLLKLRNKTISEIKYSPLQTDRPFITDLYLALKRYGYLYANISVKVQWRRLNSQCAAFQSEGTAFESCLQMNSLMRL
ncbi:Protein yellow [Eumeta japonica]|uniref:Protein yellow n=1 Tax=Eumeta variegata TaxID=151549 RepID=A0A4C1XI37_EUMVA|nr:Protein yellow [Eumeta japonica]